MSFLFYSTTIAEVEESFSQFSYNDMGGSVLTNPSLNSKNSIPLQTEWWRLYIIEKCVYAISALAKKNHTTWISPDDARLLLLPALPACPIYKQRARAFLKARLHARLLYYVNKLHPIFIVKKTILQIAKAKIHQVPPRNYKNNQIIVFWFPSEKKICPPFFSMINRVWFHEKKSKSHKNISQKNILILKL